MPLKESSMQDGSFELAGVRVAYVEGGSGFPVLMIHGSGPGASTAGNWRLVLEPLTHGYHVYAMDLIGFGQSGRKAGPPYFDCDLWLEQCRAMLRSIPGDRVGIIGHSVSGALALKLAAEDARVAKVITTGTMGAAFVMNDATRRTWTFPANRGELRKAAEGLVFDQALIDEAYLAGREQVLGTEGYDRYFSAMFAGDKQQYIDQAILTSAELARVRCPVMMIHGRDDSAFPAETLTMALSRNIPHADVVLLGRCSHSVAFEHPVKFVALVHAFFGSDATEGNHHG